MTIHYTPSPCNHSPDWSTLTTECEPAPDNEITVWVRCKKCGIKTCVAVIDKDPIDWGDEPPPDRN